MKKIAQYGNFSYHAGGNYITRVDQYHIQLTSQYEDARFPNELRKVAEFTLTYVELDALIRVLQDVRDSGPK